jgi:hypothetical protein
MNKNSLKLHLVEVPVTYDFTLHSRIPDHTPHDLGGVLGRHLDTFLLGCHNFVVTALGSCVKWP